jgi:hypothetical protein
MAANTSRAEELVLTLTLSEKAVAAHKEIAEAYDIQWVDYLEQLLQIIEEYEALNLITRRVVGKLY